MAFTKGQKPEEGEAAWSRLTRKKLGMTYQKVPDESEQHWSRDVIASLISMRSVERDAQGNKESKEVRRRSEQQSLGAVVSESADYRREEIVEGLSGDKRHLQDDEHVQFAVFQRFFESPPDRFGVLVNDSSILFPDSPFLRYRHGQLTSGRLQQTHRSLGSSYSVKLHFPGEEKMLALKRVVREKWEEHERYADCHRALDDEEPFLFVFP